MAQARLIYVDEEGFEDSVLRLCVNHKHKVNSTM